MARPPAPTKRRRREGIGGERRPGEERGGQGAGREKEGGRIC